MPRLRVTGVVRAFDEPDDVLAERAAKRAGVATEDVRGLEVAKRSLDARGKPRYVHTVDIELDQLPDKMPNGVRRPPSAEELAPRRFHPRTDERVVVVGAGPAGLFCAHRLAGEGLTPILLDRGQPVEVRGRDVSGLMHRGELKPDSNICFGEGGAGTWSDGKLYTRVSDPRVRHVLQTIVDLGGPDDILWEGKPHLGTDRLVALCKAFRANLTDRGCDVRFGAFVSDLVVEDDEVCGVRLRDGEVIDADRVVLAVGHSAREMYHWLAGRGVAMEQKPFAVGFRVEHRQQLINEIQYGRWADTPGLPTADYRVSANYGEGEEHRGVYSFCMCPGGQVVPSPTEPGGVCVNGMSHASRRGHWANSALVVSVKPEDFGAFGEDTPGLGLHGGILDGVAFQKEAERRAYELGGGGFIAPAQRLTEFVEGKPASDVRKTTYKPGIAPAEIEHCYPDFVVDHLRRAVGEFDRRMRGFLTDDALLIGVETRTSAPVRILRGDESYESPSVAGLYPVGEGAGYGGGIVSAAIDGLRIAERILEELEV
jgi:uncharacterized FAD-dependent dehydrogenase